MMYCTSKHALQGFLMDFGVERNFWNVSETICSEFVVVIYEELFGEIYGGVKGYVPAMPFMIYYFAHSVHGIINGKTKHQIKKNAAIPDG